ncbi:hypothetical protein Pla144_17870 [Bythopirellula polymerisocia]|uniref:Uncharacterized protein n=1 Tax=Bythopirellula polymerisocia TaxID=2528003 RepID=A0A5C6CY74_9BACT|nr:hypothetical protein Pla144_17870 [Bythopirellula polymerisocia]
MAYGLIRMTILNVPLATGLSQNRKQRIGAIMLLVSPKLQPRNADRSDSPVKFCLTWLPRGILKPKYLDLFCPISCGRSNSVSLN